MSHSECSKETNLVNLLKVRMLAVFFDNNNLKVSGDDVKISDV